MSMGLRLGLATGGKGRLRAIRSKISFRRNVRRGMIQAKGSHVNS